MNFHDGLLLVWACLLAVGPILGYIPQYIDIKRTRHYQGFSSVICLILLTSNILRILSYVLKPYDAFLLAQSVFMVIVQLLMLHLLVKLAARDILSHQNRNIVADPTDTRSFFGTFWAWKSFLEYTIFLALFTIVFGLIVIFDKFIYSNFIVETGFLYVSTLIESTLCMPQAWTNWKNKSTFGLNNKLVTSWVAGDLFKFFYYIFSRAPLPFTVCAIIQIVVDTIIITQIVYYNFISPSDVRPSSSSPISRTSSTVPLKDSNDIEDKMIFQSSVIVNASK